MEAATKLALFVGCLVVALVAGWALGQATVVLVPDLIVPGAEPFPLPDPVAVPEEIR